LWQTFLKLDADLSVEIHFGNLAISGAGKVRESQPAGAD
jgi:hypothetical protein